MDRSRMNVFAAGALCALAVGLGGCIVRDRPVSYVHTEGGYAEPTEVYVAHQPPPPVAEYPPPAPGPGMVWIHGYWDWSGNDWYWISGYWYQQRPGYMYVAPRYVVHDGRWIYHRSYWHDGRGRRDYHYARPSYGDRGRGYGRGQGRGDDGWRGQPSGTVTAPPVGPGNRPAAAGPVQDRSGASRGTWQAPPSSGGGYTPAPPAPANPAPPAGRGVYRPSEPGGGWGRAMPAPAQPAPSAPQPAPGGVWGAARPSPAQPTTTAPPPAGGWQQMPAPAQAPAPAPRQDPGSWSNAPPSVRTPGVRRAAPITFPPGSQPPAAVQAPSGARRGGPSVVRPAEGGQQTVPQPVEQGRTRRAPPVVAPNN